MDSIIFVLFGAIVLIGVILLVIITLTRKGPKGLKQDEFRSKWLKIQSQVNDTAASRQLAILSADTLLDSALKARGYSGNTMGERLKSAHGALSQKNAVWAAHKLRNQIAHEEDVVVKPQTVQHALAAFKTALKDLGAL